MDCSGSDFREGYLLMTCKPRPTNLRDPRFMVCRSPNCKISVKAAVLVTLAMLVCACATVKPAPSNVMFVATWQSETLKTGLGGCDETFSHAQTVSI
jgi:hypothetical protein